MINELSFSKVKLLINLESCFRRFLNNMTLSYSLTLLGIEFQIIVPLCRRESLPISFLGHLWSAILRSKTPELDTLDAGLFTIARSIVDLVD